MEDLIIFIDNIVQIALLIKLLIRFYINFLIIKKINMNLIKV